MQWWHGAYGRILLPDNNLQLLRISRRELCLSCAVSERTHVALRPYVCVGFQLIEVMRARNDVLLEQIPGEAQVSGEKIPKSS